MDNITTVFWALMTISAIGVIAFVATLATWGTQFFAANRPVRKERRESIPAYYGRLVTAH
ncbi:MULTISPECIES: hypothetical protein [Dermacoccus]|uniref:hypothetical protein n=1 Tax=Dermacoccus TaxID=57495 RepID=UPI001CA733D0|nr:MULTISPECIES: hypothetical protein [Dermacoccus]MBZ4498551.1 hypothetical protein [Dermacoccus sp. Tok2021]